MFNIFDRLASVIKDKPTPRPDYPWNNAGYPLELDNSQRITRFEKNMGCEGDAEDQAHVPKIEEFHGVRPD